MRLLLTRPEPDAQRTAAALNERGHDVVIAPLLRIEVVIDAPIAAGSWAAILITSANAAHAIKARDWVEQLRRIPVFAVGQRSAQAMRAAGFADVVSADGDVGDLARLAAARMGPGAPVLYLAGEQRSGDLDGTLRSRGFAVETVVVYRASTVASLPAAAVAALAEGVDGVLHFSRRSAEAFVSAASGAGLLAPALKPVQFCLSGQVAEPLARAGATMIRIAPQPAEAALMTIVGN